VYSFSTISRSTAASASVKSFTRVAGLMLVRARISCAIGRPMP
jgi:hypothetical protein